MAGSKNTILENDGKSRIESRKAGIQSRQREMRHLMQTEHLSQLQQMGRIATEYWLQGWIATNGANQDIWQLMRPNISHNRSGLGKTGRIGTYGS